MYRNTYVKIEESILKENVETILQKYNQYKYYIGVVKANAYGHGSYCVSSLIDGGVNYLAVSSLEEAIEIRKYEKNIPILCLEPIDATYVNDIEKYNVTATIENMEQAKQYSNYNTINQLKVHIKLDTGMNRLGFKSRDEVNEVFSLLKNSKIEIEGIYTHMATTGISDFYYDKQIKNFIELTKDIDLSKIKIVHLGRSLTLVNHKKPYFINGIRMGIIMYGFNGSLPVSTGIRSHLRECKRNHFIKKYHISETTRENDLKLKTSFTLFTEIMSIRKVKKGEFVGYGAHYIAPKDILVATLPIGYADGMDKLYGTVVINGKKYPIIGEICMDMTSIIVDEKVKLHDKVEVFGQTISIRESGKKIGKNAYHVFTSITNRVPRLYQDGTEIKY